MSIVEQMKEAFNTLKGEEMYFISDQRHFKYFAEYPLNNDKEVVRSKISVINNKELNDVNGAEYMIDHILSLNIDERLNRNDLGVVEDIANITINGIKYRLMNFASIY